MVSVLHISDLHLTQNPDWNMMKRSVLEYAGETFHDIPVGKKFLIVTGDFHNYMQDSYEPAKEFLDDLITSMGIDPAQDVFVVPGNHDVSASSKNFARSLLIGNLKEKESYRNALNEEGDFREYAMPTLLSAYDRYLEFVREMKIYSRSSEKLLPVRVHVRTWRNHLHILHLNTTLIADGITKTNQIVDALTATSDEIQNALRRDHLPCIAIGHNSYMDLDEQLQNESMRNAFYFGNISAYLCGDQHKTTQDPRDETIFLKRERDGSLRIPNIVAPRGSSDPNDHSSEFGMLLHQWDEQTGTVTYGSYLWRRNGPDVHKGETFLYKFRSDQTPKSAPESVSKPAPIVDTPPMNMGNVSAPVTTSTPVKPIVVTLDPVTASTPVTVPTPATASTPATEPAPDTTPKSTPESVSKPAPIVDTPPEKDKLSPQEQFLADMEALFNEYGSHLSIGRVYFVGRNLMKTLKDPNISLSDKSRSMMDCQNLLRATIKDMENDLEDLSANKYDRIEKLEKTLADLKKI